MIPLREIGIVVLAFFVMDYVSKPSRKYKKKSPFTYRDNARFAKYKVKKKLKKNSYKRNLNRVNDYSIY